MFQDLVPSGIPTIHGQISQRSTRGPLHFDVGVLEEKEDRVEGIAVNGSDVCKLMSVGPLGSVDGTRGAHTSFGNLGEGQARTPLQVDIVGVDEGAKRPKGLAGEEVGLSALHAGQLLM